MSDFVRRAARPVGGWQIRACYPQTPQAPRGFRWRALWRGVQQSFRLMVGVQDYRNYLRHMRLRHPEVAPMSERDFHRYCLEARFPSKAGKLGKCPC
ncbi:CstA-like transporter-associated (seleno)protein [Pantoea sp.]|uniref:YbdD/YjiX family protein n=1 Tax=Pantoea sp. TaxID=69393 RepID=UPI00289E4531|nr:CstA-like transporter-associated (seleno)protein [Pantoea sp.]